METANSVVTNDRETEIEGPAGRGEEKKPAAQPEHERRITKKTRESPVSPASSSPALTKPKPWSNGRGVAVRAPDKGHGRRKRGGGGVKGGGWVLPPQDTSPPFRHRKPLPHAVTLPFHLCPAAPGRPGEEK